MKIQVSHEMRLSLEDIPRELYEVITGMLTIDNPEYIKATKYGYGAVNVPKYIKLYKQQGGELIVPRGMAKTVLRYVKRWNIPHELKDERLVLPKVEFQSNIKLRDYQEGAVSEMLQGTQGFLVSPCGSGKTVMMVEMMARIQQPTLFIVHQKELMDQIINTAVALTNVTREEIGVIGRTTINKLFTSKKKKDSRQLELFEDIAM